MRGIEGAEAKDAPGRKPGGVLLVWPAVLEALFSQPGFLMPEPVLSHPRTSKGVNVTSVVGRLQRRCSAGLRWMFALILNARRRTVAVTGCWPAKLEQPGE